MKLNGDNLKEVLEAHSRWTCKSEGWTENDRAYLRMAYLRRADLRGVDLRWANLRGADLSCADLSGADLSCANLRGADLSCANLRGADLSCANLRGADLSRANLSRAKNVPFIPMTCPDSGSFTAWKVCGSERGRVIAKLLIPEDAKRCSSTGRKCRSDKAIVQEIQTIDGKRLENVRAWSMQCPDFTYAVGETVEPKEPFCEDRFIECASGIHFFVNRQEAVDY